MEFHPLSHLFPLTEGTEFEELVADIKQHGVQVPIAVYEDKILDGRNRYRAALKTGVTCPQINYAGGDPAEFVITQNLCRRNLTESQRAMSAARLERFSANNCGNYLRSTKAYGTAVNEKDVHVLLGVSPKAVAYAGKIQDNGAQELVTAVEIGLVSVSVAAEIVVLPIEAQSAIAACGAKELLAAAKALRARKAATFHRNPADTRHSILESNNALQGSQSYMSSFEVRPEVVSRAKEKIDAGRAFILRPSYRSGEFLDWLSLCMNAKNDAALSTRLGVHASTLSRMRKKKSAIPSWLILQAHEVTNVPSQDIKAHFGLFYPIEPLS